MYQDKPEFYFNQLREELIELIPNKNNNKVLEIGAAGGYLLVELKKRKIASEVVGVDLMHLPNTKQNNPDIDKFIFGNIENMDLNLPENYFDVIICGDVLEHLIDPWSVLSKIHKFLKAGGVIILSIPNFREFFTLYTIVVKADFAYSEYGILDKTHLRFFCKKNILALLTGTSYKPLSLHSTYISGSMRTLNKLTFNLFKDFLTKQYLVVAVKN
jgi:2-polyprenyl-3-methyl-5-hydroxy-6-metoxy-1,4-benzoquinol methylase